MTEATQATAQVGAIPADTFRARLVLARIHAGDLTIKEAADRCGLNYGSWSNWERGGKPRDLLDTVQAISDGLGIDRDWLLFGGPLARDEPRRHQPRRATTSRWLQPTEPAPRRPPNRPSHGTPSPSTRRPARLRSAVSVAAA